MPHRYAVGVTVRLAPPLAEVEATILRCLPDRVGASVVYWALLMFGPSLFEEGVLLEEDIAGCVAGASTCDEALSGDRAS